MKNTLLSGSLFALFLLSQCSAPDAKDKLNKAGDAAGQAVGEFVSGVSSGVEKAFAVRVDISPSLQEQGIRLGKATVSHDSLGTDNLLVTYVIFTKDFKGSLTAKAFDSKGLEMGRVKLQVEGKSEEAKYLEFPFDKRTNIDSDSKLVIE